MIWNLSYYINLLVLDVALAILANGETFITILKLGFMNRSKRITSLTILFLLK